MSKKPTPPTAPKPYEIPLKEIFVAIPLLATALAMTWEVGSFYPVGFAAFSFFSISEHIVFALTALPVALLLASGLIVSTAVAGALTWSTEHTIKPNRRAVSLPIAIAGLAVFTLAVSASLAAFGVFQRSALFLFASGAVVVLACAILSTEKLESPIRTLARAAVAALLLMLGTFALAVDMTRHELNGLKGTNEYFAELVVDDRSLTGVVFGFGANGVLFFDGKSTFELIPKDKIKSVRWKRHPLVDWGKNGDLGANSSKTIAPTTH